MWSGGGTEAAERTNRYLEISFMPDGTFGSAPGFNTQLGQWLPTVDSCRVRVLDGFPPCSWGVTTTRGHHNAMCARTARRYQPESAFGHVRLRLALTALREQAGNSSGALAHVPASRTPFYADIDESRERVGGE